MNKVMTWTEALAVGGVRCKKIEYKPKANSLLLSIPISVNSRR